VAVTGLGAVGLLTSLLLQRGGAEVLGCDPSPWRRELAASLGLTAVDPDRLPGEVAAATGGRGIPLLVEVSGNPDALGRGLDLLAHEGTALVASWYGTKPASLPLGGAFHRRRLVLRSTQVSTIPAALAGEWTVERRRAEARSLLGTLPLEHLATHEFPFADAAAAFAALDRGDEGLLHAALRYE
jgi:threonine dehydrogenase-like Zn-dependent dehydrogenase